MRRRRPVSWGWRRLVLAGVALLSACGGGGGGEADDGRLHVVAAFYPLAEAARVVGGDAVVVDDLTPPGAEPHDLELSTDAVEQVLDADLVIVLGGGFQPQLEEVARSRDGATLEVLEALGVDGDTSGDPHIWLDPTRMAAIADAVAGALADVDERAREVEHYVERAAAYSDRLDSLDRRYRRELATCERRLVVVQHEAFGWLVDRYGLEQEAVAGLAPEGEADPRRLGELVDLIEAEGVTTVFSETLVSPEVAQALAREAGVDTAVLDPIESRPPDGDYVSAMESNLQALVTALGC